MISHFIFYFFLLKSYFYDIILNNYPIANPPNILTKFNPPATVVNPIATFLQTYVPIFVNPEKIDFCPILEIKLEILEF